MPHKESKPNWLSVTEVLNIAINKPFLAFWRGKIGNELASQIQRESQELGTAVHKEIEDRFKEHGVMNEDANVKRMVNNFWNKFVGPYDVRPTLLEPEEPFTDETLKLSGTFDAVIQSNKGPFLADWKTSNSLDKVGVPLQLAAYCHLYGQNLWRGLAVRIDKEDDKVEVHEWEDLKPYWALFQDCIRVARYVKWGIDADNIKMGRKVRKGV